ncbi:MAG: PadR family transcriptional regulator [Pirellulales bacterium]|nr:PadR family transcriptional regulator [Pirellulales bacterium]
MTKTRSNPDFLNGVPELLILRLLCERPMYGYELVQAIRSATDDRLSFGEGCVYPILHRLEAEGSLVAKREKAGGRSRVVYRVTKEGQGRLARAIDQWKLVVDAVGRVLTGGAAYVQAALA